MLHDIAVDPERLRKLLEASAEAALEYRYRVWGFGEGQALLGILLAGELLGRPDLIEAVDRIVAPSLDAAPDPEDHLIAVEVLDRLAALTGRDTSGARERFAAAVTGAHRPVPGRPAVHRPDLFGLGGLIWVDCLHTDGPGLAALGRLAEARALVEECSRRLQDGSGLFSHGYDVPADRVNGVHWGRGQGWALWGLIGTLAHGPRPRDADPLAQRLRDLLTATAAHELVRDGRHTGTWRTIVDDPSSPVEGSVSALVASSLLTGLGAGVLDAAAPAGVDVTALAHRALRAAARLAPDGRLSVSEATPVGDNALYRGRRTGIFPWGQGPLMLAVAAALAGPPAPPNPEGERT